MLKHVLIANRGEIARRIIRSCRRLGIKSTAIYSDCDRAAPFATEADESIALGGNSSDQTYLNIEKILCAAAQTGSTAIHPGYGFLSENTEFAERVRQAGLKFIGPSPDSMRALGDKLESKALARKLNVQLLPEFVISTSKLTKAQLEQIKKDIGYPLMIKASGAGGGRGMRIVQRPEQLPESLESAMAEARKYFGSSIAFVEKYLPQTRHIEVQFIADQHQQVYCFYERDCSLQRSHQKVIEEAPAAGISNQLRQALYTATRSLALAANYEGAGTAEFLVTPNEEYYFLEVNSRLQVEHPVSEILTGYDLVEMQIRAASGQKLSEFVSLPEFPRMDRHVIEARLCAEQPARGFLPAVGKIWDYCEPQREFSRIDSGVAQNSNVSPYYDSMLAKVISSGTSRAAAITELQEALGSYHLAGVQTNAWYLQALLEDKTFLAGQHQTSTAGALDLICLHTARQQLSLAIAALCEWAYWQKSSKQVSFYKALIADWQTAFELEGETLVVEISQSTALSFKVRTHAQEHACTLAFTQDLNKLKITLAGEEYDCTFSRSNSGISLTTKLGAFYFPFKTYLQAGSENSSSKLPTIIKSELPGTVLSLPVQAGASLKAGDTLILLESMKMEHALRAGADLKVKQVFVKAGQSVAAASELLEVEYVCKQ